MVDVKSCGPICQHPSCWNDDRKEMIEALKRFYEGKTNKDGDQTFVGSIKNSPVAEALPTLKIVNLFEEDDDGELYEENLASSAYFLHRYNSNKESPFPISSAATRSSKLPNAPCASPSPSYASQYFHRQKRLGKKNDIEYDENGEVFENVKATNIQIQEQDLQYTPTFVPYLIWVPSKKNKKQNDIGPTENDIRLIDVPKVSMKNINGNNSDFGFLTTPFNKGSSVKCYSRATHTVRSSPNRIHPRRLPPISRASERTRAPRYHSNGTKCQNIHLSGDGLLKSEKMALDLNTPHNTRASTFTNAKLEQWDSEVSTDQHDITYQHSLCIVDDDTLIIQHGMEPDRRGKDSIKYNISRHRFIANDADKIPKAARCMKEARAELPLSRVTVPKSKLHKLPLEDHCKNSIPSHYLPDIEMQPIYGTDASLSHISTESFQENSIPNLPLDTKDADDLLSEEVQLSDEQYQRLFETVVSEKRIGLSAADEEMLRHWDMDTLQAPAPTPSSPLKKAEDIKVNDSDVIEMVREEQSIGSILELNNSDSQVTTKDSDVCSNNCEHASRVSPVLSKASSGDWPSDKEMMRQTYEQYRSFTPFKTPGVSLMDARLESIKEASREPTTLTSKEKSTVTPRANSVAFNARLFPDSLKMSWKKENKKTMNSKKKVANQVPLPLRSVSLKRRSYSEKVSELNVSTIIPGQRRVKAEYIAYNPLIAPFLVKKLSLQEPAKKLHSDHVPGYETFNSVCNCRNDDDETIPVMIPVPNHTPSEQEKESVITRSLVSLKDIDENGNVENVEIGGQSQSPCSCNQDLNNDIKILEEDDNGKYNAEAMVHDTELSQQERGAYAEDVLLEETHEAAEESKEDEDTDKQYESNTTLTRKPGILPEDKRLEEDDNGEYNTEAMVHDTNLSQQERGAYAEDVLLEETHEAAEESKEAEDTDKQYESNTTLTRKPGILSEDKRLEEDDNGEYNTEAMVHDTDLSQQERGAYAEDVLLEETHEAAEESKEDEDTDKPYESNTTLTRKPGILSEDKRDGSNETCELESDSEHGLNGGLGLNFLSEFTSDMDLTLNLDLKSNSTTRDEKSDN